MCKAYRNRIPIQSHAKIVSNRTSKDFIPPMTLECKCCGSIYKNLKLYELRLHIPLRSVAGSLDDLRIAGHKVENIEKLILEQEWKVKHSTFDSHLSFLSYVGMAMTDLTLICLCYCCCSKFCRRRRPKFSKWWKVNPFTIIVFKPKIVTSINSSKDSEVFRVQV